MYRSSLGNVVYCDSNRNKPEATKSEFYIETPETISNKYSDNTVPSNHSYSSNEIVSEDLMEKAFNEMAPEMEANAEKVIVVLDCANIGFEYGNQVEFIALGVKIAIDFFAKHNVSVVGFIPRHFIDSKSSTRKGSKLNTRNLYDISSIKHTCDTSSILTDLVWDGKVSVVPSVENDDLYILSYARERNGYVVSNDMYRDHAQTLIETGINEGASLWIEERRCGYTFVNHEFMLNPESNLAVVLFASTFGPTEAPMDVAMDSTPSYDSPDSDVIVSAWDIALAHYQSGRLLDALQCASWILTQDPSHSQAAGLWQHCKDLLG